MSKRALRQFLEEQIEDAKKQGVLFSIHMKATMMKISDPKIFGHAVSVYYKDVFDKHGETCSKAGRRSRQRHRRPVCQDQSACPMINAKRSKPTFRRSTRSGRRMAMVNSDKGITNLHVPSDIIIDASMPPVIRD